MTTSKLEEYPHVIEKLALVWGTEGFEPYINTLMIMDRPGRLGFDQEAMSGLIAIQLVHRQIFPHFNPFDDDCGWDFR